MSNDDCAALVDEKEQHWVLNSTICAIGPVKGQNVCDGDFGGPLVARSSLIGVISWSSRPCGSGRPDGYTRVSPFTEWIQQVTGIVAE